MPQTYILTLPGSMGIKSCFSLARELWILSIWQDCELNRLLGRIVQISKTTQQEPEKYSIMKRLDFRRITAATAACITVLLAGMSSVTLADENDEVAKLYQQGNLGKALEQADAYLATKPKDAQMRFNKALILTEQKKT